MASVFAIVLGLIVGSFLNAVIFRLHSGQSILFDRSRCVHCKRELKNVDLIPLVSFVLLGGKCRYCKKPISWQYPLVELITAIVFVLFAVNSQQSIVNSQFWFQIVFASILIVIAVYDLKYYLILDKVVYPAIALALIWSAVNGHLVNSLYGAGLLAGFFALQYWLSAGRWIGLGDVKLGLLLGILVGLNLSILLLMIAYISGALVGGALLASGKKRLSSHLPFGTFLSASAIITMLYGQQILNWYLHLIGV